MKKSKLSFNPMINQPQKKVVIIIPTYNEKENICFLLNQILTILNDFDLRILVVDDNSPDGTGQLVQSLSGQEPRIQILIRKGKRGRGTAGLVGFQKALEWKPDFVVEMDGDLSHQPQYLPNLLSQAEQNDIVIGSRFIAGGKDLDRGYLRKF
ncbi:MAG: glycosyltransferase, partial [Candidatus Aminicenantales bacterium]